MPTIMWQITIIVISVLLVVIYIVDKAIYIAQGKVILSSDIEYLTIGNTYHIVYVHAKNGLSYFDITINHGNFAAITKNVHYNGSVNLYLQVTDSNGIMVHSSYFTDFVSINKIMPEKEA